MRELVLEELLDKVTNRFLLSLAAAKRARQIKEGAKPLVAREENEYELITALDEILEKKIDIEVADPTENEVTPVEVEKNEANKKESKEDEKDKTAKKAEKNSSRKKKRSLDA